MPCGKHKHNLIFTTNWCKFLIMLHYRCFEGLDAAFASVSVAHKYNSYHVMKKGIGSKSQQSERESRRRAFQRGSIILFLNREKLECFVTLTYKEQHKNYQTVLDDLKNNFSRRGISYLAVCERHKSGFFHIHAITSELPEVISLRPGKYSWKLWKKGFSDVKFLKDTDDKFRVEKYIFKYMNKSDKIGGRYFLKSRDLTLPTVSDNILRLEQDFSVESCEKKSYNIDGYNIISERRYYGKSSPAKSQITRNLSCEGKL